MVLALLLLIPVLVDLVRRPTFRRLAFRNISRRRGEAALVVVGALLGTAIITASYIVGDTVEGAIRDAARTDLGPIDEAVRTTSAASADKVEQAITTPAIAGVDGTLRITTAPAVVANTKTDRAAIPAAGMVEVDFDEARAFGPDESITGFADAGPTPTGEQVVIGARMARTLGVGVGDRVEIFADGTSKPFTVRQVIEDVGVAGYLPLRSGNAQTRALGIFVPDGTIASFAKSAVVPQGAGSTQAATPSYDVVVSNTGGVFDGADRSTSVADELTARTKGIEGVQVVKAKADLLDVAKSAGESFSTLFSGIGYFSVIAGVLLLVNLFVMLSEERKSELGMLRALGFKRNHLVRSFAIEGSVYSVAATVFGAIAAIGVSWVIILVASGIFNNRGDGDLSFPLVIKGPSLIVGAGIGLTISMLTVWGTSARIARLNIICAIRDLPEPKHTGRRLVSTIAATLGVLLGLVLFRRGWAAPNAVAILAGPAVALFCSIPLFSRFLPRKLAIVGPAALALAWGVAVFTVGGDKVGRAGINVFVIQGIILVAAGVTLFSQADRVWAALAKGITASGRGLAARLGLAYPLARQFRTSMLLGMYAIVIFTMTFISVLQGIFGNQAPQFAVNIRAGYDIYVDSSQGNPATVEQLQKIPGVAAVTPLTRAAALATTPKRPEGAPVAVTGFDENFIAQGVPKLDARDKAYPSDADVYRAVLADPGLIIVSTNFASRNQGGGGPPQANLEPGDVITLRNATSDQQKQLKVAGVLANDFIGNGSFVSKAFAKELLAPRVVDNRHYVRLAPGADADGVASAINGTLIANGASARSFVSRINELLNTQLAFFALLRGYLGLGLLIGIAGLGVVMVRAVRERRRQIGMLRAMGVSSGVVRRAFILEAAFVALQGIVLGIGLGMITSYNLLVNSDAFGGQKLDFAWPWGVLAAIAIVPLIASLLATAWPASQAARIKPAVALRIAD